MRRIRYAGALPFRINASRPEFLLITTRRTKRWIVPKGHWNRRQRAYEAARQEAYEEAGIEGMIATQAIGVYEHRSHKRPLVTPILIFPMHVTYRHGIWPEWNQRQYRWLPPLSAERLVQGNLRDIIRRFCARW